MKRVISALLVLLLIIGLFPTGALAATFTVSDKDEMSSSWQAANESTDKDNNFILVNDIDMAGTDLIVWANKTYRIRSQTGSETLSNVVLGGSEDGTGAVGIFTDVTGTDRSALYVTGDVEVTVFGDVSTTSSDTEDDLDYAVNAAGGTSIVILGDVDSEELGINAVGSNVQVRGDLDVDPDKRMPYGTHAIWAVEDASVEVTGAVSSTADGVYTTGSAVTVGKDLTADGQINVYENGTLTVKGNLTVQGDSADIPSEEEVILPGVFVSSGRLDVDAHLTSPYISIDTNSSGDVGFSVRTDAFYLGSTDLSDKTVFTTGPIYGMTEDSFVSVGGSSKLTVLNHLYPDLQAYGNATVNVSGKVHGDTIVADQAMVTTGLALDTTEIIKGEDLTDPVTTLCKGYAPGSDLYEQTQNLLNLMADVSTDLTAEMTFDQAVLTALFHKDEIHQDNLHLPRASLVIGDSILNEGSLKAMEEETYISGYHVNLYKEVLHETLKNMKPVVTDEIREQTQNAVDILNGFFGLGGNTIPKAQKDYLSILLDDDILYADEALDFLSKFGYFKGNKKALTKASEILSDSYDIFALISDRAGKTLDVVSDILTTAEFVDFLARDYCSQIALLDDMLINQTLSPNMFVAALHLREEYRHKWLMGATEKLFSAAKEGVWDKIEGSFPLYAAVDGIVDLAGLLTGATERTELLMNATALTDIAPTYLLAYKKSIKRVQNGDTSEEALNLVKTNYAIVVKLLDTMCDIMTEIGDKKQAEKYDQIRILLGAMEFGDTSYTF